MDEAAATVGRGDAALLGGAAEAEQRRYYGPPPGYAGPPPYGPPPGLVYDTQMSLLHLGYDPGPPDGQYGPRTAQAIAAYQQNNGLPVTGQPSPGLLNFMARRGG